MMKTLFFVAATMVALSSAFSPEWHTFKQTHGKTYKHPIEEQFRMNVFLENKKKIEEHNAKYEQGLVSYDMKMNHFGDLMSHEFKAQMNGYKMSAAPRKGQLFIPKNVNVPNSVDWRQKGAVTGVKNQGQCGSCWAFSATGSLEGQLFLKTGKLVSLSEQDLVDCSRSYGNYGCNGGLMDYAFTYVKDNKCIDTESSYPYEAIDNNCRSNKQTCGGTDTGYVDIPSGDEKALENAVTTVGPVSVAIDAGHSSFQFYSSGIYDEPNCSSYSLDHGVLAVGFGSENGQNYWLVKNSWGTSWGEQGYIKMPKNASNRCGIATQASYPLV